MADEKHAPVIPKPHKVLGALEHLHGRVTRQIEEYDALPEDHPNRDRLRSSHDYNRANAPALAHAIMCLQWYTREVTGEAQAMVLLDSLVEALRARTSAKTSQARIEAEALVEEAFQHAATFVDDWIDT